MGKELKSEASFIKNDDTCNQADDLGYPRVMVSIEKCKELLHLSECLYFGWPFSIFQEHKDVPLQ